jgi:hypothetical protein
MPEAMPRSIPTSWMTWNLPSLAYQTNMLRQENTENALTYQIILIFVDGLQNKRMRNETSQNCSQIIISPFVVQIIIVHSNSPVQINFLENL